MSPERPEGGRNGAQPWPRHGGRRKRRACREDAVGCSTRSADSRRRCCGRAALTPCWDGRLLPEGCEHLNGFACPSPQQGALADRELLPNTASALLPRGVSPAQVFPICRSHEGNKPAAWPSRHISLRICRAQRSAVPVRVRGGAGQPGRAPGEASSPREVEVPWDARRGRGAARGGAGVS